MKRLAGKVTAIFLAVVMVFTFMPLTGESFAVHADDVGTLGVYVDDDGMLTWDAVEDANHYTYYVEDKEIDSEQEPPEYGINLNLTVEDLISEGELPEAESYAVKVEAYDSDDVLLAEGSAEFSYTPEDPGDPEVEKMNASIDSSGILSWDEVNDAYRYCVEIQGNSWTFGAETTRCDVARRIDQMIKSGWDIPDDGCYEIHLEATNEDDDVIAEWGPETFKYESSSAPVSVGTISGVVLDEEAGTLSWNEYDDGKNPTVCYRSFIAYGDEDERQSAYYGMIEDTTSTFRWDLQELYEEGDIAAGDTVTIGVEAYTYIDPENIPDDIDDIEVDDLIKIGEWSENIVFQPFADGELIAEISDEGMLSHTAFDGEDYITYSIGASDEQAVMNADEAIDLKYQIDRMIRDHIIDKAEDNKYAVTLYSYDEQDHMIAKWEGEYEYDTSAEPVEVAEIENLKIDDGVLSWDAVESAEYYTVEAARPNALDDGSSDDIEGTSIEIEEIFRALYNHDMDLEDGEEIVITVTAYDETGVTIGKGSCSTEYMTPENLGEDDDYQIVLDYDEETDTLSWDDFEGAKYYTVSCDYDDVVSKPIRLEDGCTQITVRDIVEQFEGEDGPLVEDDECDLTLFVNAYDEGDTLLGRGKYEEYYYEKVYPDIDVDFDEKTGVLSWQKTEGIGRYELDFEGYSETFTEEFDINGNIYSVNVYDFVDRAAETGGYIWPDDDGLIPLVLCAYEDSETSPCVAKHRFRIDHELPHKELENIDVSISDGILSWDEIDGAASYTLELDSATIKYEKGDAVVTDRQIDLDAEIDKLIESKELFNVGEHVIRLYAKDERGDEFARSENVYYEYISDKAPFDKEMYDLVFENGRMTWTPVDGAVTYSITVATESEELGSVDNITGNSFDIDDYLKDLVGEDADQTEWHISLDAYDSEGWPISFAAETYYYPGPATGVPSVSISGINTELKAGEAIDYSAELNEPEESKYINWNEYWRDKETGQACEAGADGGETQSVPLAGHTYEYVLHIELEPEYYFPEDVSLEYGGKTFTKDDGLVVEFDSQNTEAEFSGFVDDVTVPGGEEPSDEGLENAIVSSNGSLLASKAEDASPVKVTYSGEAIELDDLTVTVDGKTLSPGTDYEVSYENNTNAGTAKVTISGKGEYDGEYAERFFTIEPKKIDGETLVKGLSMKINNAYTGSRVDPAVTITIDGKQLTEGTDYVLTRPPAGQSIDPGTYAMELALKGNYEGGLEEVQYVIVAPISSVSITLPSAAYTYTGKQFTPAPAVTFKSSTGKTMTLSKGADYSVSYAGNVNAGTATVKVTGKGRFTGTKTATFKINKANNTMTVKGKKAILKAKTLKKSNKTLKVTSVLSINNPIGALKYVKKKGNKKISINKKNGKVKVGKKLKKGTYKVTVAVTAAGDANHNAVTKKVKFKVIVK